MTGTNAGASFEQLANPSQARDALLSIIRKGSLARLLRHLQEHPEAWSALVVHAGAVIEALVERKNLNPHTPPCRQILAGLPAEKIRDKAYELLRRRHYDWVAELLAVGSQLRPAWLDWYQIQADLYHHQHLPEAERQVLLEYVQQTADPETHIAIARRLAELDALTGAFAILASLYQHDQWRSSVLDALTDFFLAFPDSKGTEIWDKTWGALLDAGEYGQLWSLMLAKSRRQTSYDWQAFTDGIGAMEHCLAEIEGRDLERDVQGAQRGHELALGLMRLVKGTQPLEKNEQSANLLVLDLLFALENRWREHGVTFQRQIDAKLGTVWIDEQVFLPAVELLCEQTIQRFVPPVEINCRIHGQDDSVVIELCAEGDLDLAPQREVCSMDQAFLQRVLSGHGVRWVVYGSDDRCLAITIPTNTVTEQWECHNEELADQWFAHWFTSHGESPAVSSAPTTALGHPFQWARLLRRRLQDSLVSEWAEQIRIIVHDLKNGFTFMQQWINQALSDPYSWSMAVERVRQNKQRMIDALADLRQWVALSGVPSLTPVSLIDVVRKVIDETRAFWEYHGVRCAIHNHHPSHLVLADQQRLSSALTNLVKNAVEAMPHGGTLSIAVITTGDDRVQLTIEDTGSGIPADELPELFTVGRTTKAGGSGVGLAAVAQAVRSMGASIAVESSVGVGTRFIIRFPPRTPATASGLFSGLSSYPAPIQQALRASQALLATGDYVTVLHLWLRALSSQLDVVLKTSLASYRVKPLVLDLCIGGKRRHDQISDASQQKLARLLALPEKEVTKRSETVVAALLSGDWSRLSHPLHWAIMIRLFDLCDQAVYPFDQPTREKMSRWLCQVAQLSAAEKVDQGKISELGSQLDSILVLLFT